MALTVRLLGVPEVRRDGQVVPAPRGNKPWGLLAYLLLTDAPVSRASLCSLLFAEAEDPRAALRWNLSALRQVVGDRDGLSADPVVLGSAEGDEVDVLDQAPRCWGGELLGSMTFGSAPTFDLWLETQRARLRGARVQDLHDSALRVLAAGGAAEAVELAGRLVTLSPYDEAHHALLVRSLAAAGDGLAAARRVAACRELFRRDLGVEPGPELDAAAAAATGRPVASPRVGRVAILSQVEAGEAAISAGAVDAGLECLRRAAVEAAGDADSSARALLALGSALVHAVRGRDEEGVTALHRAVAVAEPQSPEVAAAACVELGYVEYLRGHLDAVDPWLVRAESANPTDAATTTRVETVRGSALSDAGRYAEAQAALCRALAATDDGRRRAYVHAMIGRAHLLCGELDAAREALEIALDGSLRTAWRTFTPWPESLLAEVDLVQDRVDEAGERLETAFATSCELGDPCWEGVSGRGRGQVLARRGRREDALETLFDARRRSRRVPDGYRWVDAWTLEALCQHLPDRERGHAHAIELTDLTSSTGMRHLLELGMRHRARWGESACLDFADHLGGADSLTGSIPLGSTPAAGP